MRPAFNYVAFALLGVFAIACVAPLADHSRIRQFQLGYIFGCAGWFMLIYRVRRRPLLAPSITELFGLAVLLRLLLLAAPVSDDVNRYLWEGRVRLAGSNPYLLAPDDPMLEHLRDASWRQINHKEHPAVYPPLAQIVCTLIAAVWPSPAAFKLVFLIMKSSHWIIQT